jgi:hypothetical protein
MAPDFNHCSTIFLCDFGSGMLVISQSWLISSKKDFISASSIHFDSCPDWSRVRMDPIAFLAPRRGLKP